MTQSMHSFGVIGLIALSLAWCINYRVIQYESSMTDHDLRSFFQAEVAEQKESIPPSEQMVTMTSGRKAAQAAFRAVILGAPGSGKGTISARIVKQFGVSHISSGDKLRAHIANQTELGREVKKYLDSGSLVPDETMIALISEEIKALGDRNWLLDGFPRTVPQAEALQKIHPVTVVINVNVPDFVIVDRLKNRWLHLPSGRVYNIGFNDPKVPGKDDATGEPLSQRPDDKPQIVEARLHEYATKTKPVIDYYKKFNLLKSFTGETTDGMWPDIKKFIAQNALIQGPYPITLMVQNDSDRLDSDPNETGFPRTVFQAKMLDAKHDISCAINLVVSDSEVLERVKNRWTHIPSGRVYNIGFNDPKVPGKDDVTGESLSKRPDDRIEVVMHRLNEYKTKTEPVIAYYKKRGILSEFTGETTNKLWPKIQECLMRRM